MKNDSDKELPFDFANLPEGEWTAPLSGTICEVRGDKWIVGGYNALEELQRIVRGESMTAHRSEVHLWYRGLTLYFVAQYGEWDFTRIDEDRKEARHVQMDLLGLGLSSAKVAIDTLLAGYYSPAYATIRHMLETVLQWLYLEAFPDRAYLWRTPPIEENIKRMGARRMHDKLVSRARRFEPENEREVLIAYLDGIYRNWELLSAGAHPSGAGLAQVVWPDSTGKRQAGSIYDRYMTLVGFDHGFFALRELLSTFETTDRVNDEWRLRLHQWESGVADFRTKVKHDPDVMRVKADQETFLDPPTESN